MQLQSPEFSHQQMIPIAYTCKGDNINPPLHIIDVPAGVVSLVLTLFDPDSPSGKFVHWLLWNIPPNTKEILPGTAPIESVMSINDFGEACYGGPCPHQGTHRYVFDLYALDIKLETSPQTSHAELLAKIKDHTLAHATLTGIFSAN